MKLSKILKMEIIRSNGVLSISEPSLDKQPSKETIKSLENEISAQIMANEAMSSRSMQNALKSTL